MRLGSITYSKGNQLIPRQVQGCMWEYDLYNWSTLFQDKNGTTPVTAYGQPVGLNLDLSQGLALGTEKVSNGTFDSNIIGWTASGSGSGTIGWNDGKLRIANASPAAYGAGSAITTEIGKTYKVTVSGIIISGATPLRFKIANTNNSEAINYLIQNASLISGTITGYFTATATTSYIILFLYNAAGTIDYDSVSVKEIPGNHRFSESAARPTLELSASGKPCLKYNGVGQFMQTNPFAWSSDEVCVVIGVRKLAGSGIIVNLSNSVASNNGSFAIKNISGGYATKSKGSTESESNILRYKYPITSVLGMRSKVSTDVNELWVNNTLENTSVTDQGSGDFGSFALYFGSNGASEFAKMEEYSSCGFNRFQTDSQFAALNRWVNNRTTSKTFFNGYAWNESTNIYTTLSDDISYYDTIQPCLVTPGNEGAGDILLNRYDYNKRADTGATVALDGSVGQVMMRFPKFYYKYNYATSTHNFSISSEPLEGFTIHPWFNKSGDGTTILPYRYIGVYPAVGWTTTYQDGDGTNAWFNTTTGKIGSIAGKKCLTNFGRQTFRAAAARVGTGWQQLDFYGYSALKMLYIARYGNFDSQSVLGAGNSKFTSFTFGTCMSATGKVKSVAATGQSTTGGNSGDYSSLFGLEDVYGGIWGWVDGWNINSGANYVCNNPANFADDTTTNYTAFGVTNPTTNNYQATLQQNIGLLPASVSASPALIGDYYYYASGWRAPLVGGRAGIGAIAGVFALHAYDAFSAVYSSVGGRVCF